MKGGNGNSFASQYTSANGFTTGTGEPSGSGTSVSPYLVSTINNLYWITQNSDEWDKDYKQTANIDASTTSTWDSNAGFSPIGDSTNKFTGSYDGQHYSIDNLTINRISLEYKIGRAHV